MSADDFALVIEYVPDKYVVRYGFGAERGRLIDRFDNLKDAIRCAQSYEAEYFNVALMEDKDE